MAAVTPVEMKVTVMVSSFCMIEESGLASKVDGEFPCSEVLLDSSESSIVPGGGLSRDWNCSLSLYCSVSLCSPFCCSLGGGRGEASCSCSLLLSESECCFIPLVLVLCCGCLSGHVTVFAWSHVMVNSLVFAFRVAQDNGSFFL